MSDVTPPHRRKVMGVLIAGLLMGAVDISIVGPALPAIKDHFSITDRSAAWIFTIYVLFFLIGTPLMAKLSDRYGRRAVYILDVALFAAGSLLLALAPSITFVLAGRAMQGFGAGGIFPVANAVVGDMFPPEKRGTALGLLGAVFGIAFIIGPVIGGLLLLADWRLLFLVNLPVAGAVIYASITALPTTTSRTAAPFDLRGMLTLALLLASFSYGISRIDTADLARSIVSENVFPYFLFTAALIPLFIGFERTSPSPVLPVSFFKNRQIVLTSLMAVGIGLCEASFVFMPAMAVTALNVRQSSASFMMIPMVVALSVSSVVAGKLLERVSAKSEMIVGSLLLSAGLLLITFRPSDARFFLGAGFITGAGFGVLPVRYSMLSEVPSSDRTAAQGLVSMNFSIGEMVGGVLAGAIIASYAGSVRGYAFAYAVLGFIGLSMFLTSFGFQKKKAGELEC